MRAFDDTLSHFGAMRTCDGMKMTSAFRNTRDQAKGDTQQRTGKQIAISLSVFELTPFVLLPYQFADRLHLRPKLN
jgi:hypothetical protein